MQGLGESALFTGGDRGVFKFSDSSRASTQGKLRIENTLNGGLSYATFSKSASHVPHWEHIMKFIVAKAKDDHASTTEDVTINIDVVENDPGNNNALYSVDQDDPLTQQVQGVTQLGAAISIINGEVHYDPTHSAVLQGLGQGETANDSFIYSELSSNGKIRTATVTVTVTGVNDAPVIVPQLHFTSAGEYPTPSGPLGPTPTCVALRDLNGDGKLDLTAANDGLDTVSVFLGRGDGSFEEASVGSSRVDLQACKLEYSIVSPK